VTLTERVLELAECGGRGILLTVVEGPRAGTKALVLDHGEVHGDAALGAHASELADERRSRLVELEDAKVFVEVFAPPPRLLVFGAVDTAEHLCAAANQLGWRTIVADARRGLATRERLPSPHELLCAWPDEALERVRPDADTAVVVLTHEERFDVPALVGTLDTDAFYVGALGSRRAQERRRERLREAGVAEEQLERIAGPCGLDLGAESPAETALSILAEAVARRRNRSGGPLSDSSRRIHADAEAPALS
jgi:xanthine dehydrogenase accessory factor